jgi:hypothetical protein
MADRPGIAELLRAYAALAVLEQPQGGSERAARLLGAAEALRKAMGVSSSMEARAEMERLTSAARSVLGEAKYAAAFVSGRDLTLEEALVEALEPV